MKKEKLQKLLERIKEKDFIRQLLLSQRQELIKELVEEVEKISFRKKDQNEIMQSYQNRKIGFSKALDQVIKLLNEKI